MVVKKAKCPEAAKVLFGQKTGVLAPQKKPKSAIIWFPKGRSQKSPYNKLGKGPMKASDGSLRVSQDVQRVHIIILSKKIGLFSVGI